MQENHPFLAFFLKKHLVGIQKVRIFALAFGKGYRLALKTSLFQPLRKDIKTRSLTDCDIIDKAIIS